MSKHYLGWILQTIIFACTAVIICIAVGHMDRSAMSVCEIEHSHDVCFQALNR